MDAGIGIGAGVAAGGAGTLYYGAMRLHEGRETVRGMTTVPLGAQALQETRPQLTSLRAFASDAGELARKAPHDVSSLFLNPLKLAGFVKDAAETVPPSRVAQAADQAELVLGKLDEVAAAAVIDQPNIKAVTNAFTHGSFAAIAGASLLTGGLVLAGASALDD